MPYRGNVRDAWAARGRCARTHHLVRSGADPGATQRSLWMRWGTSPRRFGETSGNPENGGTSSPQVRGSSVARPISALQTDRAALLPALLSKPPFRNNQGLERHCSGKKRPSEPRIGHVLAPTRQRTKNMVGNRRWLPAIGAPSRHKSSGQIFQMFSIFGSSTVGAHLHAQSFPVQACANTSAHVGLLGRTSRGFLWGTL